MVLIYSSYTRMWPTEDSTNVLYLGVDSKGDWDKVSYRGEGGTVGGGVGWWFVLWVCWCCLPRPMGIRLRSKEQSTRRN